MLKRDKNESKRLDFQYEFMRAMGHGNIFHPSIPRSSVHAVADVGTGTGVRLNDMVDTLRNLSQEAKFLDLVGFDISAEQIPPVEGRIPETDFVVHDMT